MDRWMDAGGTRYEGCDDERGGWDGDVYVSFVAGPEELVYLSS